MIAERLEKLRSILRERGIDWYIITGNDPHGSEYPGQRWRTRAFISGFTGSAGVIAVSAERAILWTDSRYYLQAEKELEGTGFELMREGMEGVPTLYGFLSENSAEGSRIGVDSSAVSITEYRKLYEALSVKGAVIVGTGDLIDSLWENRPSVPSEAPIRIIDDKRAGESVQSKLQRIRRIMRDKGARWTFISSLDDIAWITNLRSSDIPYNPLFYSFLFISLSKAVLFIAPGRFDEETLGIVSRNFQIEDYGNVEAVLPSLIRGTGLYSPDKTAAMFIDTVGGRRNIISCDISTTLKSMKNKAELDGMRKAHILDGAAFVSFLAKLDKVNGIYTEKMISDALERERKRMDGYIGPSFSPISAFGANGAVVHYRAPDEKSANVMGHGLLVLDTGSQFSMGTTDVTRTLFFGMEPTEDEKRDYTLVLKGHLALLSQVFPKGTRGVQLDAIAKQFMWQNYSTFFHGTGHGVGCCLMVHEGPQRISPALIDVPLMPGMVVSDEPGLYKEGRYGIRIENLLAVREDEESEFGSFLSFENLTYVPYEKNLIDTSLLTDDEIEQINSYHRKVFYMLSPYLDSYSAEWLKQYASPIERISLLSGVEEI